MFDFDESLSKEAFIRKSLIDPLMPFLGKQKTLTGHDYFLTKTLIEAPFELKIEVGYFLSKENRSEKDQELLKFIETNYKTKIRPTLNAFIEIFSVEKENKLGGVFQTYYKDKNPPKFFCMVHVFPYDNTMIIINGKELIKYINTKDFRDKHKFSIRIANKGWDSLGIPVNIQDLIKNVKAIKLSLNCGEEEFNTNIKLLDFETNFDDNKINSKKVLGYLKKYFPPKTK